MHKGRTFCGPKSKSRVKKEGRRQGTVVWGLQAAGKAFWKRKRVSPAGAGRKREEI
jgi:hypothetical protein